MVFFDELPGTQCKAMDGIQTVLYHKVELAPASINEPTLI